MFDQDLWESQHGLHGMQVGRAAAMSDWAFRREEQAGDDLIQRLMIKRWAKAHPEKIREYARKHGAKPETKAKKNARRRKANAKRLAAMGPAVCSECGKSWQRTPRSRAKFCGSPCQQRNARYRRLGREPLHVFPRAEGRYRRQP